MFAAPQTPAPTLDSIIPEAYRNKEWVQNILKSENPNEEMFKQYEHAQSLIGKKQGLQVPDANATPEQVAEFHKAIGVPEDAALYDLPTIAWEAADKGAADILTASRPDELMNGLKSLAKEIGLTKTQFTKMMEGHDRLFVNVHKAQLEQMAAAEAEINKDFDTRSTEMFGTQKAEALDVGNKLLDAYLSPQGKALASNMKTANDAQLVVADFLRGWNARNVKGDTFSTSGAQVAAITEADRIAERQRLTRQLNSMDPMDPRYESVKKQWNESYAYLQKS